MSDNIKILRNYLLYFLTFFIVCIVGVSGVFALDYYTTSSDTQTYYDNSGSSLTEVSTTWNESLQAYLSGSIRTAANSYGAFVVFNSPIPIIENHTYSLSISFIDKNNISLSSKPRLSIGTNQYHARTHYINSSYNCDTIISKVVNDSILQYTFIAHENTFYIGLPWTTIQSSNQDYIFNHIVIDDLGSEGVSETTINNSLNNQTNIINNSINSSTNTIVDNSNQNRQAIINNQNENTEKEIESQKVCNSLTIDLSSATFDGYLNSSGTLASSDSARTTDFIQVFPYSKITRIEENPFNLRICFYDSSKSFISCLQNQSLGDINIPLNANYVRASIRINTNTPKYFIETCQNGNQALNDSITGLNDSLNDDDSSGATSEASDFFSSFTTNTFGLTSIITAPLNLIQSLSSSSCSDLHLPLPYLSNKYLDLPCMTTIYQTHFGAFFTMYQTITYGIIAYWVCVRIFNQVKDFKNPEHDEIEVVDL